MSFSFEILAEVDLFEVTHPHFLWWSQMLEHVPHATGATGQSLLYERTEDRPAQTRPIGDRGIDVGSTETTATIDERIRFLPQGRLQAVRDMTGQFGTDEDRLLPD